MDEYYFLWKYVLGYIWGRIEIKIEIFFKDEKSRFILLLEIQKCQIIWNCKIGKNEREIEIKVIIFCYLEKRIDLRLVISFKLQEVIFKKK